MANEDVQKLIIQATRQSRGEILQATIEIETMINIYIAEVFSNDTQKIEELICLILAPRVGFEDKRQIFSFLVDKYDPEFKTSHPNYRNDLKDIIEERNRYAHYPIEFSKEALQKYKDETTLTFVRLKNSKNELVDRTYVSQKIYNDLFEKVRYYSEALKELVKIIPPP